MTGAQKVVRKGYETIDFGYDLLYRNCNS